MKYDVQSVDEYIKALPKERKVIIEKIRAIFLKFLPKGFEEIYQYDMIAYVVPLSRYPKGYLRREDEPLAMISLASQKNHIAVYHMGIYMDDTLLKWTKNNYQNYSNKKIDMGKSCIRFKNMEDIPYKFLQELAKKLDVDDYIKLVESNTR